MTKNKLWFVTHSETGYGEPNGIYCPDCFHEHIEPLMTPTEFVSIIHPENCPVYECGICRKDYRD